MERFTREQYIKGDCTHRQYYGQYVTVSQRAFVLNVIGLEKLMASTDPHLNDIPLAIWDRMADRGIGTLAVSMKSNGDYLTQAGQVCILKEAARQLIDMQREGEA